jgi:hypothetical protein
LKTNARSVPLSHRKKGLTPSLVWPYRPRGMARTAIKSTYALDEETVRKLERLASRWQVSKSEVLRRVIKQASEETMTTLSPLQAFRKLQQNLGLTDKQIEQWSRDVRRERVASSIKHEWRSK